MTFQDMHEMSDVVTIDEPMMNSQSKPQLRAAIIIVHLTNTEHWNRSKTLCIGGLHSRLGCPRVDRDVDLALINCVRTFHQPLCNDRLNLNILLMVRNIIVCVDSKGYGLFTSPFATTA